MCFLSIFTEVETDYSYIYRLQLHTVNYIQLLVQKDQISSESHYLFHFIFIFDFRSEMIGSLFVHSLCILLSNYFISFFFLSFFPLSFEILGWVGYVVLLGRNCGPSPLVEIVVWGYLDQTEKGPPCLLFLHWPIRIHFMLQEQVLISRTDS